MSAWWDRDGNSCTTGYERQMTAVLYAPRGVEMVHERTVPMTRDNTM